MRLRWCLPPLAILCLAGVLWISTRGGGPAPEELLASARTLLGGTPPERAEARSALDEALRLARSPEQAELRAEILDERSKSYAEDGLVDLALADCKTRFSEWGVTTDTLARATELCLRMGEPGLALEHAEHLAALDPSNGPCLVGRCRVALADLPLAALERLAESELLPSRASEVTALAQRAAVYADRERASTAPLAELLDLFPRADESRRAREWVQEAAEHLALARSSFLASLAPESRSEAVAGLQDLLLRGGAAGEAADLGLVTLSTPDLTQPMPVLARTASALAGLGRTGQARGLILDLEKRNPDALRPKDLPSLALRDELQEWCRLLEALGMWEELHAGAVAFWERNQAGEDPAKLHLSWLLIAESDIRVGKFGVKALLDAVDPSVLGGADLAARVWLTRADLARGLRERTQERYALLLVTRTAPPDPEPPLRSEIGRAWQRLAELNQDEGNLAAAEIGLTHALRCSSERAAEVSPLWHEVGRKALASRGASSPYLLYTRAKNEAEAGQPELALADARALLADYPGLGPALEVVSRAASDLRDYPRLISASLELMERGWPAANASLRLRSVPDAYFLPQDRVRWLLLDPRGSLEAVVQTMLADGNLHGAALAAKGGPATSQPPELLPLLARVLFDAGESTTALEMLKLLPIEGALFRSCTALALRAGLRRSNDSPQLGALPAVVAKVVASGPAEDLDLPSALDALLGSERMSEAESLLAWLAPQSPPFVAEVLLRQTAARALARRTQVVDEDLERAAALLEDGRPELGRLILAREQGDDEALEREAWVVLDTPFARSVPRRAALLLLAGEPRSAAELLASQTRDGQELLGELVQACLASLAPEELEGDSVAPLSPALLAAVPAKHLLIHALALEVAPWRAWGHARIRELASVVPDDPWVRALLAHGWLALGSPGKARSTLGPAADGETDARLAWLRVRAERAAGAGTQAVRAAEVDWFAASGRSSSGDPALAGLEAALLVRRGAREEAVRTLELALEKSSGDPALRQELAELENTEGRRTRACELYSLLLSTAAPSSDDARVLAFLDALRAARDEGEISEERWWGEVEALEAEETEDPAPVRELAARAFEGDGQDGSPGRADALERLARFRARTLDRPLDSLRLGEGERWIELLARGAPERAVAYAEDELRRDPSRPGLWRASAVALLAVGQARAALERLEALNEVAPEPETARLLALTSLQVGNDPAAFTTRLAAMKRFDPGVADDPMLAFYAALHATREADQAGGLERALELWKARLENGLAAPEHGRALALRLFYAGRRAPALAVLDDSRPLAHSALEKDVLEALAYVMRSAPAKPRQVASAPPSAKRAADDEPGKNAGGGKAEESDGPGAGKGKKPPASGAAKAPGAAPAAAKDAPAKTPGPAAAAKQPSPPGKDKGEKAKPRTKPKKNPK